MVWADPGRERMFLFHWALADGSKARGWSAWKAPSPTGLLLVGTSISCQVSVSVWSFLTLAALGLLTEWHGWVEGTASRV